MNKFRKYLVLLFVLAMCLLLTPKIDSYALIDGADQGDRDTDYDHSGWKEGVASSKTGYLVWLSDSSGAYFYASIYSDV